ncbi:MAG TPA: 4-(cytidine 5'-diphospho)-2-C-methyl-D-erythritol kinase [Clostridia bacterium]|nr:4-(cytidine 5'-diphospho)-2-C-methyl-D-erythritol kinase [Clostridia bacterium]
MPVPVRSFAKINIGLAIGAPRPDGFHELRTIYQTIAAHDVIRVDVKSGTGIEVRCKTPGVPEDESNTCYRVADRVLRTIKQRGKVTISIEKNLPVQGGIGGGSSNAVATMFALERALRIEIPAAEKLRIASEVGSDLPLFLLGGTVLGCGRGEEVYPVQDLPEFPCVLVTPDKAVSTPQAFRDWDEQFGAELTRNGSSATINTFSRSVFEWLGGTSSGVPVKNGDRAETLLLDLVRTGIANDFERVVFPQHPELRDVKRVLERHGASYASLSGSGSSLYGLFRTSEAAESCAAALSRDGVKAIATTTLPRENYREQMFFGR